ncbi:MAG: hypothetical protein HY901_14315 [Deltaproteobacteria bacterium]|nr:hypothetical protein [Deltaproteobacteria bacterium]
MLQRIALGAVGIAALLVTMGAMAASKMADRMERLRAEKLEPRFEKLKPVSLPKTPPKPGEWLAEFAELGQSVAEYRAGKPERPTPERRTIYLQPIGEFAGARAKILSATADYTERFFGLPVRTLETLPLSEIPPTARRRNPHPGGGQEQILAPYLIEQVLFARKPRDAIAILGLTNVDLYPGPSWNYAFGQAAPDLGVGVWSLYRNGDPEESAAAFRLCLKRAIATATHELGHLFGVMHCVAWECQMNGVNHQEEADSRPLDLCPACLQKVIWFGGADPEKRYRRLAEFARQQGLTTETSRFEKKAALCVGSPRTRAP